MSSKGFETTSALADAAAASIMMSGRRGSELAIGDWDAEVMR